MQNTMGGDISGNAAKTDMDQQIAWSLIPAMVILGIIVVVGIHDHRQPDLLVVVEALDRLGLGFGFGEGRQQHRRQDGYDRDDHEQFYEGKATTGAWFCFHDQISLMFSTNQGGAG